ncbi:hypothetical protein [Streptomyces sp. NPDC050738]|uniref:hypothetical protein n=1 Tax=Streptomyces sp. NPDC050738 TaxID=3154744 RepID=UPI003449B4DC
MTEQSDATAMGDDVYQPGDPDAREDQGILDAEDTLSDPAVDPYDEGWSPPERPLGVEHTGNTADEQRSGETLGERLAEERPDTAIEELERLESDEENDDVLSDDEAGADRSGRPEAPDEGAHEEAEKDMLAEESAAVRVVDPGDDRTT